MISVVVPIYNERDNLKDLLERLNTALSQHGENYKLIFIDDKSTDGSFEFLLRAANTYPLKVFKKIGKKGKSYSIYEGFSQSSGDKLVMIDADLQYPPEEIPSMLDLLEENDIVVANRKTYEASKIRKFMTKIFRTVFSELLHSIDTDAQSGLKALKREVFETIQFVPSSPWTFDLEFLLRAKDAGFKSINHDITFTKRAKGTSKINTAKATFEIGINALVLKFKSFDPLIIKPENKNSMNGAGVSFGGEKYITHTTLNHKESALKGLVLWQKLALTVIAATSAAGLFLFQTAAIVIIAVLSAIYFLDVVFNLLLIARSLHSPTEISFSKNELSKINNEHLPIYTILCPLYKEADVLPLFVDSIKKLDWPKNKLDVILLLEEDDHQTINIASELRIPKYFRTLIVPDSLPKTKPKACNFGLAHAKGEYVVIYDAEDIPDPQQLKKAYLAFNKLPKKVVCLQAKLNYHNPSQNLLTRFFTAEYSLWFDIILTGLQSIQTTIPLGGTSNHFRTRDLHKLQGWDPFNVTEDADLGVRLFRKGYKTAVIDSVTLEEANSQLGNWLRQRSRWIKGYMQTYLVHMRNPIKLVKTQGIHAILFQLILGGKITFLFINPFLWLATISYFAAYRIVGPTIEALYPAPVFYMAVVSLAFGNFLFMYYYMIGCVKREQWSLIKFVFLVPLYWIAASTAAVRALYQLITKPYYWEKTVHGLHIAKEKLETNEVVAEEERVSKIRKLIYAGTSAGGVLVLANILGNFLNFLYSSYLARTISVEDFGLINLIGSFLLLASIPLNSLSRTVTHKTAFYIGKYNNSIKNFWSHTRTRAILLSILITELWLAAIPILTSFFHAQSQMPFIIFAPVWIIGAAAAVDGGFLSGNLKFKVLALILITEAITKLIFTAILVQLRLTHYVYAAIPLSMSTSFLIGWLFARSIKQETQHFKNDNVLSFEKGFYLTSVLTGISSIAFLSFDVILVNHFLPPIQAGQYALIALVGKMIYFVGSLFNQFITPLVSREEGAKRNSKLIFYKIFLGSAITSFAAYIFVGVLGYATTPILFGDKAYAISRFLPLYGIAIFAFTQASSIVGFYQTKKKYLLSIISLLLVFAEVVGIYYFHSSLDQVVTVMAACGILNLAVMITLHFAYEPLAAIARNTLDFLEIFSSFPNKNTIDPKKLRILIFNWRDVKHTWSGGAEVYIHEIAKRLVTNGHGVTIFCGNDGKSRRNSIINGIRIIRRGGFYTVYFWAFIYYFFRFRGDFDIIIDSENGIPFFTPLYASEPVIGLVHHVHQEVFRTKLIFPLAQIGKFLEGKVMPFVYKNARMITVSNSSKEDMEKIGLGQKYPIEIVHPGIDLTKFKTSKKTEKPSVLYLGRLQPYKSLEIAIQAMQLLVKKVPDISLTIAGDGESRKSLEKLVRKLGLENVIQFIGRISEKTKVELFGKSWVMVQPSKVEGWGITAIEANASGTPVVAANVPGLRDSVSNPHSGYLVSWGDAEKFAEKIELILTDKKIREDLEKESRQWSKQFSWNYSTRKLIKILNKENK